MSPAATPARGSLVSAMNWMGGLSLLLFWLPVFGPLIAGVGGVAYLTDWIGWGVLAGLGVTAWLFAGIGPLLVGAGIGGAFSLRAG